MRTVIQTVLVICSLQLVFFVSVLGIAGTITRSTKTGSTSTQFQDSYAAGNTLAVADLDTDLNSAYSTINGSIDSSNVTDNSLTASDLAASSVGTSELQPSSVTAAKIADATITAAKIAAAQHNTASGACTTSLAFSTGETTLASVTITAAGGAVALTCDCALGVLGGSGANGNIALTWKRDAVTIGAKIYSPVIFPSPTTGTAVPIPCSNIIDTPTAGSHTYTITAVTSAAALTVFTGSGFVGSIYATENRL